VDFLICAVALARNWYIFTLDRDFARYSAHFPVMALSAPQAKRRSRDVASDQPQLYARLRYAPSAVSTRIFSPSLMNGGT